MKKLLIVVDMQNDFVTGALGTKEAVAIVPAVVKKIEDAIENNEFLIFTRDTHHENYMSTQEGKNLPVPHCIEGTDGWEIIPELRGYAKRQIDRGILNKLTFGSMELANFVQMHKPDEIELIGLCTDICVISNAMLAKAAHPEAIISVDSACCAGVSPETHNNALEAMKMCQIIVK